MGGMYLEMLLSELAAGGSSVFAALGSLPSPPPLPAVDRAPNIAPTPAPSAFLGAGHSLKGPSPQSSCLTSSSSAADDDLNLALAMSMLSSGKGALKIAIVAPQGARQVLH
jgi:hypothetical protein